MANAYRGEVEHVFGGELGTLVFRLGMNELAALEAALGLKNIAELGTRLMGQTSIRDVRTITKHALSKHHPKLTESQVGDIMDVLGLPKTAEILGKCLEFSFDGPNGNPAEPGAEASPPNG